MRQELRNWQIIRMRQEGETYTKIGIVFSLTPARVRQICVVEDDRVIRKRRYLKGKISTTLYNLQVICDQLQIILEPPI